MQAAQPLQPSQRAMVRRLEAICAHKHLDLDELAARRRLRLCFRVPKLTSGQELQAVAAELAAHPAALVVLDPLYLAVAGAASGADTWPSGSAARSGPKIRPTWPARSTTRSRCWPKTPARMGRRPT
jgi:hypothetical protein